MEGDGVDPIGSYGTTEMRDLGSNMFLESHYFKQVGDVLVLIEVWLLQNNYSWVFSMEDFKNRESSF